MVLFELKGRLLPPVCRHVVLHTLWSYAPLSSVELKAFCRVDVGKPLLESATALNTPRFYSDQELRAEEIILPALERKIFKSIQHKKNKMEWPLNDNFKKGLRNALTGL